MVETWWKHEKLASFEGPAKGLLPSRRPAQVTTWIGRGREGEPNPPIVDVYAFASTWWSWWCAINPEWRKRVGFRMERSGEGDWGSTGATGPNGFLNVMICLRWWRDALRDDLRGWDEAVADVD
ncbi:hypothetical protein C8F04DRAFT_939704 [Mycena alexandri]|uniref:Uncharacterized protein n=1 Tax=Mycena alexandri TaxID=1745969 RepID=A0AAD6XCW6_9AGAR|nr:hypothetical protein C8F04DRAFT_939704 [Mycena alexandri]